MSLDFQNLLKSKKEKKKKREDYNNKICIQEDSEK